jgi:hypothetical protein
MMRRFSGACLSALVVALAVAVPLFAKPPDLPQDTRIVVSPQLPGEEPSLPVEPTVPESGTWRPFREGSPLEGEAPDPWTECLREMLSSSLFLEVHPFIAYWGEVGRPMCASGPIPAETTSPCPYLRQKNQCQPVQVLDPNTVRSVMDNLRALKRTAYLIHKAQQFAEDGRFLEALACLQKARGLCPGSSYDSQIEELAKKILAAAETRMKTTNKGTEEEASEDCGCCFGGCCCGWLNQFGLCWMSQFIEWCKEQETKAGEAEPKQREGEQPKGSEDLQKIQEEWERIWFMDHPGAKCIDEGGTSPECDKPAHQKSCGGSPCSPLEAMMQKKVSLSFKAEPLSKVLHAITSVHGMPIVIDYKAIDEQGISLDDIQVYLSCDQVTLKAALHMLLDKHHLKYELNGCVVTVTTGCGKCHGKCSKGCVEPCEDADCPKTCCSACPKCEALHAKYCKKAGVAEQVKGLMKACYLAIDDGRFEKAADLARQAYALDPARVEADPLIYKLHLMTECGQTEPVKGCCPMSKCPKCGCPAKEKTPACDDPELSPRPDLPEAGSSAVRDEAPPDIFGDLPEALDEVLTGKDELAGKEQAKKCPFALILDPKYCGVSLSQVVYFLQDWYLPPVATEHGMHVSLGLEGIGVQGTVPFGGVNYTVYWQDGMFLVWMTPETTAK